MKHDFIYQKPFFGIVLFLLTLGGCKDVPNEPVKLWARDASITETVRLYDPGEEKATIHFWQKTTDVISWKTNVKKGNYKVSARYSHLYSGSAISFTAGNQQFATLIETTSDWDTFMTFDLGVIAIEESGVTEFVMKATQLGLIEKENKENMPDIHWLLLTPTTEKENSQPVDILKEFKGKAIFDGKTFSGWKGNNGQTSLDWFRIEDGAIVGGTMEKPIPRNEFLSTTKEYGDFELRLKYKMKYPEGTETWNAGVQLRSQPHPTTPHEMIGYQADILPGKWGALYDEQRRWKFLGNSLNQEEAKKVSNSNEWNSYIIRCEGPRIRIWINGVQTLDFMEYDPAISRTGFIALQIHEDKNPCEVWYKDVEIQELR